MSRTVVDHCPACRIRRELTEHRDATYKEWNPMRGMLNFATVLAKRACPDYQPREKDDGADDVDR